MARNTEINIRALLATAPPPEVPDGCWTYCRNVVARGIPNYTNELPIWQTYCVNRKKILNFIECYNHNATAVEKDNFLHIMLRVYDMWMERGSIAEGYDETQNITEMFLECINIGMKWIAHDDNYSCIHKYHDTTILFALTLGYPITDREIARCCRNPDLFMIFHRRHTNLTNVCRLAFMDLARGEKDAMSALAMLDLHEYPVESIRAELIDSGIPCPSIEEIDSHVDSQSPCITEGCLMCEENEEISVQLLAGRLDRCGRGSILRCLDGKLLEKIINMI